MRLKILKLFTICVQPSEKVFTEQETFDLFLLRDLHKFLHANGMDS